MPILLLVLALLLFPLAAAAAPPASAASLPDVRLGWDSSGNRAILYGKQCLVVTAAVRNIVWHSSLGIIVLNQQNKERTHAIPDGIYIFDEEGKLVAYGKKGLPRGNGQSAVLSPGKTRIAIFSGDYEKPEWLFYSFPGLVPLKDRRLSFAWQAYGTVGRQLTWIDENTVVTTIEEASKRPCPAPPCKQLSVKAFSLKTGESAYLARATELCDYTARSREPATAPGEDIILGELCFPDREAWRGHQNDGPWKKIPVKLPPGWIDGDAY